MSTDEKIQKLVQAIRELATEQAFTLRHLSDVGDIRLSDSARMEAIAKRLDELVDSLEAL